MPGLRFKLWPLYGVKKFPWVQVPAGQIAVVIAQVGQPLPIGAKSGVYKPEFGNFSNLATFVTGGGQKGVQRPVLPPGTLVPIHPVAFMVLTSGQVYGLPVSPELVHRTRATAGVLKPEAFGLTAAQLQVVVIAPVGPHDTVGVVTALEGPPLLSGDIASRLGGYDDVVQMENAAGATNDPEVIEMLLGSKNHLHNNYQDFQLFLDAGGKIGLQHDPLLYGAYLLNPFLVQVELVPMLVVNQGEVAVIKAYVGLPTSDTSGTDFKFGSIVRPGHRGIWQEPLRTGKYPINPRCYAAEIVPTSILTLNWSDTVSQAHSLDANLEPIEGKSREGFVFRIELQVQIHVPDTKAPKVISMVGTMLNLVNEVLQSAVGNHFRNTLQDLEAVRFIETRMQVQQAALTAVTQYLGLYDVETKGVYIQDVVFPPELVTVLTQREIANQEKATFAEEERAQTARVEMEKAKGTADMQALLAQSQVSIDIRKNEAASREAQAQGEAAFVELTGRAEATKVEAIGLAQAKATEALGLARAEGFKAQKAAVGEMATALVAVANAVADGHITIVPEVLVTGGGGALDGLAATLMRALRTGGDGGGMFGGNGADGAGQAAGAGDGESVAAVEAPAPAVDTERPRAMDPPVATPKPNPSPRPQPGRDN
jgi:flavin-binding protein dodecin